MSGRIWVDCLRFHYGRDWQTMDLLNLPGPELVTAMQYLEIATYFSKLMCLPADMLEALQCY